SSNCILYLNCILNRSITICSIESPKKSIEKTEFFVIISMYSTVSLDPFTLDNHSNMRIILPFIYLCIVLTMPALAQDDQSKQIAGIVKDQDGVTLPGVSIAVVGSNQGTVSDENGEFTLQVARGDSLQFTYIGKKPETLVVDDRNILEMILYDDASLLQQVQVVAFGTQKKESVISSIESVNVADLKQPASNLTGALAGRIPGIISYQSTGEPGADNAQFFIR